MVMKCAPHVVMNSTLDLLFNKSRTHTSLNAAQINIRTCSQVADFFLIRLFYYLNLWQYFKINTNLIIDFQPVLQFYFWNLPLICCRQFYQLFWLFHSSLSSIYQSTGQIYHFCQSRLHLRSKCLSGPQLRAIRWIHIFL